ncbi:MAG: lipoate--protein ligase family protein, partial [Sulfolobales archaeon]
LRSGSSDVIIGTKKVSGSAQVRDNKALLQHGTLLLRFDPEVWLDVIKVQGVTAEFLRSRIGGLLEFIDVEIKQVFEALIQGFIRTLGDNETFIGSLTPDEIQIANKLYKSKYSNEKWNLLGIPT